MWLSVQYGGIGRYGGHLVSVFSTWFPCHKRALLSAIIINWQHAYSICYE